MNGIMAKDVSVVNAYDVPSDFHARFGPVMREYRYLIHNHPLRSPFAQYRMMWVTMPLDVDYLTEAASHLIGEHDFASFCKKVSADENTVRRIDSIAVTRDADIVRIRIRGTAFVHNQIRATVGTLIEMQKYGRPPEYMKEILEGGSREFAGFTAPPYGLYLSQVAYDPPLDSFPAAFTVPVFKN